MRVKEIKEKKTHLSTPPPTIPSLCWREDQGIPPSSPIAWETVLQLGRAPSAKSSLEHEPERPCHKPGGGRRAETHKSNVSARDGFENLTLFCAAFPFNPTAPLRASAPPGLPSPWGLQLWLLLSPSL